MKLGIIELDRKGILPRINENENSFYERGNRFLEVAYDFKGKLKKEIDMIEELSDFEKHFLTYPDWVSCSYKKIKQTKKQRITLGRTQLIRRWRKKIPIVFLDEKFSETTKEFPRVNWYKETILRHELVHAVRYKIERRQLLKDIGEAFAYSLDFGGEYSQPIKKNDIAINLYKSLENIKERGHLESNLELGYILLRMTVLDVLNFEKTFEEVRYSREGLEKYIKSKVDDNLRFRLIAERLG